VKDTAPLQACRAAMHTHGDKEDEVAQAPHKRIALALRLPAAFLHMDNNEVRRLPPPPPTHAAIMTSI
jgi:hypothetical protein